MLKDKRTLSAIRPNEWPAHVLWANAIHTSTEFLHWLKLGLHLLIRTQLWVASAIASMTAAQHYCLQIPMNLCAVSLSFFASLFVYNAHALSHPARKGPGSRRTCTHLIGGLLIALIAFSPFAVQLLAWPGLLLCFLYSKQIYIPFKGFKPFCTRLDAKRLWGLKSIWIGLTVSLCVTYLPIAFTQQKGLESLLLNRSASLALALAHAFALCLINATLFDQRDHISDRKNGVASLSVLVGPMNSLRYCKGALLILGAISLFLVFSYPPLAQGCWIWTSGILLLWGLSSIPMQKEGKSPGASTVSNYHYEIYLDGCLFAPALLAAIASL